MNRPLDIKWGDFWKADLARHDVVYAYLSPAVMPRLWRKAPDGTTVTLSGLRTTFSGDLSEVRQGMYGEVSAPRTTVRP